MQPTKLPASRPAFPATRWRALAAAAVLAAAAASAGAAPVQYLSGAATQTDSPNVLTTVPVLPGATGFERYFTQSWSAASTQTYGAAFASASASLQAGTLRAATSFSSNGVGGGTTLASAYFGDGYAFSGPGGTPYAWNGQTVTFNIDVSGIQSASIPQSLNGEQQYFDFSIVSLLIYQPGTLDQIVPFCNGPGTTNVVGGYFWSVGANTTPTDPCGGAFLGNLSGTVDETLSVSFAPTGDFAWALGIRMVNVAASGQSGPIAWDYAFGHTVSYGFTAPDDAIITTASGIAPGGQAFAVPVPSTVWLLGAGLALLVLRRRVAVADR